MPFPLSIAHLAHPSGTQFQNPSLSAVTTQSRLSYCSLDHLTSPLLGPLLHPHSPWPTQQQEGSCENMNQTWPPLLQSRPLPCAVLLCGPHGPGCYGPGPRIHSPSPAPTLSCLLSLQGLCIHRSLFWIPPLPVFSFDCLFILPPRPTRPPEPEWAPRERLSQNWNPSHSLDSVLAAHGTVI